MKNTISLFILMLVVSFVFTGCKKYEEGPSFTLRSVKNRLTNGNWELENLTIGGVDSTLEYRELGFEYSFQASDGLGAKEYSYTQDYTYQGQLVEVKYGSIMFTDKGDKITFQTSDTYSAYTAPLFGYDYNTYNYVVWDITKLSNKEFWLETKLSSMKVSMKLKKK